jgi:NAD(P)-dependent dehydrogenase (short-subunit alcohol dehydrogenase family)
VSPELTGKTALVTGSTSGIGQASANAIAALGARVIVSGRHPGRGEAAVTSIRRRGGDAHFVAADLTELASVRQLASDALALGHGHVDILVNNAGISVFTPLAGVDETEFDRQFDVNVKAMFFLTQALVPSMVERGGGVVVNLSSGLANRGVANGSVYSSTKGAVEAMTRSWASELGPLGVRVNTVSPGVIMTPGTEATGPAALEFIVGDPAGRPGEPDELGSAVAFLVSDAARFIHGVVLPVDGGALSAL